MKIGIISDTHGKLHPPVLELTASCDVILHAGDVDNSQTLDQLWMHLKPNASTARCGTSSTRPMRTAAAP